MTTKLPASRSRLKKPRNPHARAAWARGHAVVTSKRAYNRKRQAPIPAD